MSLRGAAVHAGPVPEAPPRPSATGRSLLVLLGLAVVLALAARVIELRPLELLRDAGNIGTFLKGYLRPSLACGVAFPGDALRNDRSALRVSFERADCAQPPSAALVLVEQGLVDPVKLD